jgi:hypothetical protein
MVTSHKVTIFVPSCNSTLWNTGSARNLTLTITFLKQCEYLSTGRSLPVFARLTAWGVDILLLLFISRLYLTSDSDNLFNLRLDLRSIALHRPHPPLHPR